MTTRGNPNTRESLEAQRQALLQQQASSRAEIGIGDYRGAGAQARDERTEAELERVNALIEEQDALDRQRAEVEETRGRGVEVELIGESEAQSSIDRAAQEFVARQDPDLVPYTSAKGVNISLALRDGVVDEARLSRMGYSDADIQQAQIGAENVTRAIESRQAAESQREAEIEASRVTSTFSPAFASQDRELVAPEGTVLLETGELVDKADFETMPRDQQQVLRRLGVARYSQYASEHPMITISVPPVPVKRKYTTKEAITEAVAASASGGLTVSELRDPEIRKEFYGGQKESLIAAIPVVGTIHNWSAMGPVAKSFSIAGDVLFFASFAKASTIPKAFAKITKIPGAQNIDDAIRAGRIAERATLKAVSPKSVVTAYDVLAKAQDAYAENLVRTNYLKRTLSLTRGEVAPEVARALAEARRNTLVLRQRLIEAGDGFARAQLSAGAKGKDIAVELKAILATSRGEVSPEVARALRELSPRKGVKVYRTGLDTPTLTQGLGRRIADDLDETVRVLSQTTGKRELNKVVRSISREISSVENRQLVLNNAVRKAYDSWEVGGRPVTGRLRENLETVRGIAESNEIIHKDLRARLSAASQRLAIARSPGGVQLATKRLTLLEQIDDVERNLNDIRLRRSRLPTAEVDYDSQIDYLLRKRASLLDELEVANRQYRDFLREMGIEAVPEEGSIIGKGGTGIVAPPTRPTTIMTATGERVTFGTVGKFAGGGVSQLSKQRQQEDVTAISGLRIKSSPFSIEELTPTPSTIGTPSPSTITSPVTKSTPSVISETGVDVTTASQINDAVNAGVDAFDEAKISGATDSQAQDALRDAVKNRVNTEAEVRAQTETEMRTLTSTATKTALNTISRKAGKLPPFDLAMGGISRPGLVPDGSLLWLQGFDWKYIPPPYNQSKPISLGRNPPAGAKTFGTTPAETLQILGQIRGKVPKRVSVDLGFVDVFVNNGREIEFAGGGVNTDVGERLSSNTKGMSLNGYLDEDEAWAELEIPRGKNRVTMSKRTPRRKAYPVEGMGSIRS